MDDFITRYGLAAILLCGMTESEIAFVLGGVSAHLGLVWFPAAVLAGALGALMTDSIWFGVGHWKSDAVLASRLYASAGGWIEKIANRLGIFQIFIARFIYGTRAATMFFWGVRRLRFWKFLLIDFLGCLFEGVLLGGLGYLASESVEAVVGKVHRVELWLAAALVAALLGLLAFRAFSKKEIEKLAGE